MIMTTLSIILGFLVKALSFALAVVFFVVPLVLKIAFGLFVLASSFAVIWMILVGLTIFLAPSGGVRKHMDISYPDPEDITPFSQATKDRITLDEVVLTLALPKTYLPQLTKETGVALANFTVDTTMMFATDAKNIATQLLNKARATRLGARVWRLSKTEKEIDEEVTPIGYRPSW